MAFILEKEVNSRYTAGSKIFSRMEARGEGCIVADRMVGRVGGIEAEKLVARVSRTEGKKEWLTQI